MDTVICFNDGAEKRAEVLQHLGIEPGSYMVNVLHIINKNIIFYEADRAYPNASKEVQQLKRLNKGKIIRVESFYKIEYGAGEF